MSGFDPETGVETGTLENKFEYVYLWGTGLGGLENFEIDPNRSTVKNFGEIARAADMRKKIIVVLGGCVAIYTQIFNEWTDSEPIRKFRAIFLMVNDSLLTNKMATDFSCIELQFNQDDTIEKIAEASIPISFS